MEFFTLELWKLGCSFFDRKYENVYFTYQNMVIGFLTWKYRYNIFCIKCSIFHVRVMKIGMQILWQGIRKCLFHISKYGHRFSHMKYGIFSYFSFENCHAVFPSRNIKYCLFNIWKKCIHSPTRNVEFSQRFSCLSSEILYISIKKAWMKVFWYETWNSVYFT